MPRRAWPSRFLLGLWPVPQSLQIYFDAVADEWDQICFSKSVLAALQIKADACELFFIS